MIVLTAKEQMDRVQGLWIMRGGICLYRERHGGAQLREEGIELWASKPGCRTEALGSA